MFPGDFDMNLGVLLVFNAECSCWLPTCASCTPTAEIRFEGRTKGFCHHTAEPYSSSQSRTCFLPWGVLGIKNQLVKDGICLVSN